MFFLIVMLLSRNGQSRGAPMEMLFSWILFWVVVLILTPLITMRSFAEERQSGTIETLFTAPVSDFTVVMAKYMSALGFYILMWIPTLLYPVLLAYYSQLDPGPVFSGYLGTLGVGAMLTAVGLLCSSLTKNQIVAALISFALIMALFLTGLFRYADWIPSPQLFEYIDLISHMEDFSRGIVDTRHLMYYGTVTGLSLFATVQITGARRWRG
jgi:ABC-2 type transport system permease protein